MPSVASSTFLTSTYGVHLRTQIFVHLSSIEWTLFALVCMRLSFFAKTFCAFDHCLCFTYLNISIVKPSFTIFTHIYMISTNLHRVHGRFHTFVRSVTVTVKNNFLHFFYPITFTY